MNTASDRESSIEDWDRAYRAARHQSTWPWSHVVSLVHRHVPPFRGMRVLELGCGAGANIPFFLRVGASYSAIEGSASMVDRLREAFPEVGKRIFCADFTQPAAIEGEFDVVLDRGSITHNATTAVRRCMGLIHAYLRPGGHFIGTDWFSTESDEYKRGEATADSFVRDGYREGPFADIGLAHFFDRNHLEEMIDRLELVALYHRTTDIVNRTPPYRHAAWDVVARRSEG